MEHTSAYISSIQEHKMQPVSAAVAQLCRTGSGPVALQDNRPQALLQRQLLAVLNRQPLQRKANATGLPDQLKAGIENLSGYSMDDVKVHYNSAQPAQLQAHAYAQGTEIHVAPGQEKHLPHEAWHVVQQKQGRVRPTVQLKSRFLNNDSTLEKEADAMDDKAYGAAVISHHQLSEAPVAQLSSAVVQRLPAPLGPDDVGKLYRMTTGGLSREIVTGRFVSPGRGGMMNFIRVGDDDAGEELRVHYTNVIGEVSDGGQQQENDEHVRDDDDDYSGNNNNIDFVIGDDAGREDDTPLAAQSSTSGREIDPEKMFASRIEPEASSSTGRRKQPNPKKYVQINMEKIRRFLETYRTEEPSLSLRMRKEGQRLELDTSGSDVLREQLRSRKKKKGAGQKRYIDPSYHETVQYVNVEFGKFCEDARDVLNTQEMYAAYDILLAGQGASSDGSQISGMGPSPLTAMTPLLMTTYQDMHYRTKLQKDDETASTRAYEAAYTGMVFKELPFSQARAFALPLESGTGETSMVNTIGATLDMQTPTSGNTLGQGKVYSAIFKHFQKSMELLNQHLDETEMYEEGTQGAFEKRTKQHLRLLDDSNALAGLYHNEEAGFDPSRGFAGWGDLRREINTLVVLIAASLDMVPERPEEAFEILVQLKDLKGDNAAFVKQFELIGAIIGVMIKTEKRQLLNAQMFGRDRQVEERLDNLYRLHRVESAINEQITPEMGAALRREQERRNGKKDIDNLL